MERIAIGFYPYSFINSRFNSCCHGIVPRSFHKEIGFMFDNLGTRGTNVQTIFPISGLV